MPEINPTNVLKDCDPAAVDGEDYALVLLNSEIRLNDRTFIRLWDRARCRACVDGGADRLLSMESRLGTQFTPDYIVGDFDSVLPSTLRLYSHRVLHIQVQAIHTQHMQYVHAVCRPICACTLFNVDQGVSVHHIEDQNSTDLCKCISLVGKKFKVSRPKIRVLSIFRPYGSYRKYAAG